MELGVKFAMFQIKDWETDQNLYWHIVERLTQSSAAQQFLRNHRQLHMVFTGPKLQSDPA